MLALGEFGFPLAASQVEEFAQPNKIWQIGAPPYRIDVLTSISGVDFEEAWSDRVPGELGGVPVCYISREHFIRIKRATSRMKDEQDADRLEEL